MRGDENQVFGIKDTKTGTFLNERFYNCFNMKFIQDGNSVIYTKYDKNFRPFKVYYHILGQSTENDELLM